MIEVQFMLFRDGKHQSEFTTMPFCPRIGDKIHLDDVEWAISNVDHIFYTKSFKPQYNLSVVWLVPVG